MRFIIIILNVVYVVLVLHALFYGGLTNFVGFLESALLGLVVLLLLNHLFLGGKGGGGGHH
jgi:uncharacterized membrane protein YGL010W